MLCLANVVIQLLGATTVICERLYTQFLSFHSTRVLSLRTGG